MSRKKKPKTIGQRIRAIRVAQGLSQAELAKRSKLAQGHLSEVERTDYDPVAMYRRIAKALGVEVRDLID